jgi:hypothetical protein
MPKSDYDRLKNMLHDIAKEESKDITTFLKELSVDDSEYSEKTIDTIFARLFVNRGTSPEDAKHIIMEKKRLLHIVHIIRYELSG